MLSLALCRVPRAARTNACQCGSEQRSAHRIAACTVIRRVRRQSYACWVIWTIALTLWRAGSAHSTSPIVAQPDYTAAFHRHAIPCRMGYCVAGATQATRDAHSRARPIAPGREFCCETRWRWTSSRKRDRNVPAPPSLKYCRRRHRGNVRCRPAHAGGTRGTRRRAAHQLEACRGLDHLQRPTCNSTCNMRLSDEL
jgi:hypothetical protein